MIRFLMFLIITFAMVTAAYSGTFYDSFDDGNADGWEVTGPPNYGYPPRFDNGYLVMDTMINGYANAKEVRITLRAGDAQNWDSYILRCKVRFSGESHGRTAPDLTVLVRLGQGEEISAYQTMVIVPKIQLIYVRTTPPHAVFADNARVIGIIKRGEIDGDRLRRHVKLDHWYSIKIVAERNRFEFFFDDNLVTKYIDNTAVPGTVMFKAFFGMVVHLDDVTITGPGVPDINASPASLGTSLTTTWGAIKVASPG